MYNYHKAVIKAVQYQDKTQGTEQRQPHTGIQAHVNVSHSREQMDNSTDDAEALGSSYGRQLDL